jgi:hypothetical protein
MLAVFTKPLELLTAADIAELPTQTWPEGYEVEFKESLPYRSGSPHPWLSGQGGIGDYARDEILAEVVAFANSQGGSVFVGVAETSDNPPRAHAVTPLPRVGDLARRFEDQARSCIDPPLSRLQVRAIDTDGEGGGVLVFRTSSSRAAPHRLTTTREGYIRRGSSTMKMTMREIQDMTLNSARGLVGIDATFKESQNAFLKWSGPQTDVVAYRVTALPLVDIPDPGRLFSTPNLFLHGREFQASVDSRVIALQLPVTLDGLTERPRLRGIVRRNETSHGAFQWELHQSRLSDLWISVRPRKNPMMLSSTAPVERKLCHSEILAAIANTLNVICHYRTQVSTPDAEYGIEIELTSTSDAPFLYYGFSADSGMDRHELSKLPVLLPRYSVGPRREFNNLLAAVDVDIYDGLEIRRSQPPLLNVNI